MTDDPRRQTFATVYALVLVVSAVAPFVAFAGSAAAAPSGMATIPDDAVTEDVPTDQSMPLGAAELRGGVLASDHADSLEVILTTADHAPTVMNGDSAAVSGNGMALVLRDQDHSAGREIAIDSGQLQDALGYAPEAIYGTHEDGSEWTATAEYVDGYLVFDVPHFSDNTVTFSGTVDVSLSQATDATTAQWGLSNYDSASNVSVDVTGVANTETDTVSKTLTSGIINADIAGDREPPSTTLTVEGNGFGTRTESTSFTNKGDGHSSSITVDGSLSTNSVADGATVTVNGDTRTHDHTVSGSAGSKSVNIGGNVAPTGQGTANPQITVTGGQYSEEKHTGWSTTKTITSSEVSHVETISYDYTVVNNPSSGRGREVEYKIGSDGAWNYVLDAYAYSDDGGKTFQGTENVNLDIPDGKTFYLRASGKIDGTFSYTGGSPGDVIVSTQGGSHTFGSLTDGETRSAQINLERGSESIDVSKQGGTVDWSLDYRERTVTEDPSVTISGTTKTYNGRLSSGETTSLSWSPSELSGGSNSIGLSLASVPSGSPAHRADYTADWQERDGTLDPSVDIDGDGFNEVAHTGVLTDGETATGEITPSLSDDTWSVSGTGSPVAVSAEIVETTVTKTPSVELNGQTTTIHDGTLADGETVQTTLPKSQLQEGANRLNVSVANGGVSADAPQMQVNVEVSHDASDQQSVGYTASAFEESYNVSRTYADTTSDATVTIPFESSRIIGVPTVEYRIDGGEWKPVDGANYRFEGTTLEIGIADAYGGELPAGATASVRATGRKIEVANGSVSIVDPTKPGSDLETQLKIDSRSEGFHINIGPTESGDRVHYAESSVYPTEDYVIIDASGDQRLYFPALKTGDTVRVKHLRTRVVAEQGDVRIDVVKPGENPELDISPGPGGSGDPVTVEYYNTESGVKYLLNSLSRSVVIDSDVAQSPAVFSDDDSDETWSILKDAAPQPSGDSSGIFRPVGQFREQSEGLLSGIPIVPIALGGVSLVGLLLFARARNEAADATAAAAASTTGSALQRGLRSLLDFVGQLVAIITRNRRASIATGIGTAIIAAWAGLVDLPSGTGILLVVAGVPIASWLILRRTDAVSRRVWLASTIAATILGLEFVAPGTVQTAITQLTSEQVAPLLLLLIGGALVLYFRLRRTDESTPEEVTNVTLGITASDEEGDGD